VGACGIGGSSQAEVARNAVDEASQAFARQTFTSQATAGDEKADALNRATALGDLDLVGDLGIGLADDLIAAGALGGIEAGVGALDQGLRRIIGAQ